MTRRAKPKLRAPIGRVHVPDEDPAAPGCCICHRPLNAATDRHVASVAELPTPDPDQAALTARMLGENRED
jgi:hypothetical protein